MRGAVFARCSAGHIRPSRCAGAGGGTRLTIMPHGHTPPIVAGHTDRPKFGTRHGSTVHPPGEPSARSLAPRSCDQPDPAAAREPSQLST